MSTTSTITSWYDVALGAYEKEEDLLCIIRFCLNNGLVICNRDFFICAYKSHSSLIDTESKKEVDKPDTWVVCMAAGNMKKVFAMVEPLDFVAYERFDGKFRVVSFDRLRRIYGK